MARRLGRHRSTVHRELKRCGGGVGYDAGAAQAAADVRAERSRTPKLAADAELGAAVLDLLEERWSPHAVAAQLRSEGRRVCAETIYAACYDPTGGRGLPEGSWRHLPRRRRRRKPRCRHTQTPSPLGVFKPVADRPAAAGDRSEAGHWEGDLIIGAGNRSAVATLVERTSRQTLTVALGAGYDAESTAAAVTAALGRQPTHLVKSLTWDQGREMARWADIEEALGIDVYFCDPRSPWQRPTNEHTNGMLRRWLPKGTDLNVGAVRLAVIEDSLNTMPRKLHDWDSPHSVYTALCRNHR
jgi:IS30 family transposase